MRRNINEIVHFLNDFWNINSFKLNGQFDYNYKGLGHNYFLLGIFQFSHIILNKIILSGIHLLNLEIKVIGADSSSCIQCKDANYTLTRS